MAQVLNQYNDMRRDPVLEKIEDEENRKWAKTVNAETCRKMNILAYNRNVAGGEPLSIFLPPTENAKAENKIVHDYAVKMVGDIVGEEAWEIYKEIARKYRKYIELGIEPSKDFDVCVLEKL